MKVQNIADLRRQALDLGAEVEVDGKRFNTEQARVSAPRAPKVQPPAPATAPVDPIPSVATLQMLTMEQVEAMLAERDAAMARQIESVTRAFAAALSAMPKPDGAKAPHNWKFHVEYDRHGAITDVTATPIKG